MAYFGWQSPLAFAIYVVVAVFLINGAVFLGVGIPGYLGCDFCASKFGNADTALSSMTVNSTGIDKGCIAGALVYRVTSPGSFAANDRTAWKKACVLAAPLPEVVSGAAAMGIALLLLLYCLFASPPAASLTAAPGGLQKALAGQFSVQPLNVVPQPFYAYNPALQQQFSPGSHAIVPYSPGSHALVPYSPGGSHAIVPYSPGGSHAIVPCSPGGSGGPPQSPAATWQQAVGIGQSPLAQSRSFHLGSYPVGVARSPSMMAATPPSPGGMMAMQPHSPGGMMAMQPHSPGGMMAMQPQSPGGMMAMQPLSPGGMQPYSPGGMMAMQPQSPGGMQPYSPGGMMAMPQQSPQQQRPMPPWG